MASYPTDSSATHASAHSGLGHVVPLWLLAAVFGALLVLTGLTVAVAQVDLGNLNLYLALAIAAVKASLVVLFFMHLFWDRPFNAMIFIGCLLFVSLFIGITLDGLAGQPTPRRSAGKARRCKASIRRWGASRSERSPGSRGSSVPRDAAAVRCRGPGNDRLHRGPDDVLRGQHRHLPARCGTCTSPGRRGDFPPCRRPFG